MSISSKTLLTVLGVFLVAASRAQSSGDEQDVRIAVEKVQQAILKHDANALDQLYGDDLTVHYADGSTADKSARIKTATTTGRGFRVSEEKIKLYGTTAVVTGISSSNKDAPSSRFMQVWVKRAGGWQEVALSLITIKSEPSR
ncbi:MAG: nuclear transport factor 2 family protein [Candidatus Sulfotelmatobacter sp.]|jgi:ketosteroid isomerase-like protein